MSAFSNYDAWKTASPYDDLGWEENYPQYRCEDCGCFLKNEPDRSECFEETNVIEGIDGCSETEYWSWVEHHRTCKKCGHDNVLKDA